MMNIKNLYTSDGTILQKIMPYAVTIIGLIIAVDLALRFMEGPVMDFFFPKLYFWIFAVLMLSLIVTTVRAMDTPLKKYLSMSIIVLLSLFAMYGTPDQFPFYAPGQDQHVIEGERTRAVEKIEYSVAGTEIRPGALDNRVDVVVLWLKVKYKAFFRAIVANLLKAMVPLDRALGEMPMWIFMAAVYLIAWRVTNYRIAIGSVAGLSFISIFDLWPGAMTTMTVVGTATFLSMVLSIPIGIAMSKSDRIEAAMRPVLDMAQTMPSFVYLIPAIFFLGIGMVPAVFATIVYAVPPGIRLTNLGIRLVSPELKEAARAFGTTPWQMLVKVELPLARPTIMAGMNQTVMMALAMVVIATLVGAGGLGSDVYAGVQQLEFGRGLMGGIAIVVLAVIIDRISQGFAQDPTAKRD